MSGKKSYFIDVENVGSKTIEKFLTQDKTSDVVVVTGPQSNFKASGVILEELSKGKNSRVDVIHTDISRDQLADKLLLIKVGEYRGRFPNRSLIIVSKDKGFKHAADVMNKHWDTNIKTIIELPISVNKLQQPKKKEQPEKKEQPKAKPPRGEWKKYWEIISKRPIRSRPKTYDALINSIKNISKTGIEADPDAVIHGLKSDRKITIKSKIVTWLDG